MRWQMGRRSDNIEDRRGMGVGGVAVGGGIGTLLIVVVALFLGIDPSALLQGTDLSTAPPSVQQGAPSPEEAQLKDFVAVVLADTEDTWRAIFHKMNHEYREPKLVLFSGLVRSACGNAQSAAGPFYCPSDEKVYLDLSFFRDLRERFRAPGDFAQAYVIAHEVGHHVQSLLGISDKVRSLQSRSGERDANALSVRLELQADCFAGVWANNANRSRQILEQGDIESGLNAAAAIGDDRLQRQSQGYVVPDAFTHGTSAQRVRWFKRGLEAGDIRQCDTFNARQL
ncbi:MAG TPA: neutral zinc metallopeptidase [Candidatus Methylomirabilis sp.]|nr:neutral zinc metallopeptidase [Candidatus Methylomirabilis sp.]